LLNKKVTHQAGEECVHIDQESKASGVLIKWRYCGRNKRESKK
jgi:hypothetical protein